MDLGEVNVELWERRVSVGLGGAFVLGGMARRSWVGGVLGLALLYRGLSGHSYLYELLGINTANRLKEPEARLTELERSITIQRPAEELYRLWSDPSTLSKIMGDSVEVTRGTGDHMHWRVSLPLERHLEWETHTVENQPGRLLRWQSLEGAPISNDGMVSFHPAPADWGTVATLRFRFDTPGGSIGSGVIHTLGIMPDMIVEKALRRFKSLAETGEIPTLEHNPAARATAYAH
ncbi:hypothetical protein KSC_086560 [Ktedonobacter sp. SOSP1-52]|uniref:SRPBCC family protein n=1 Tax=Ktedonobacter sp. SOSP1-52 TaxID=2778366 RepID=UPI001915474E|nr:YgaP-like transmembrane domain [Ktedonobacter sp. SOSP1-52]GHO69764.1 hypothetical protein KSC_086560 [Ktedonobacter sp. SOSP1-52]